MDARRPREPAPLTARRRVQPLRRVSSAAGSAVISPGEGWQPTPGMVVTPEHIQQLQATVDKSSTPASRTYRAYLEKLSGAAGADLHAFAAQRSLGFARLWYVKALVFARSGHYADQFDEHHEENERTAAAGDKLDSVVDSFMRMLVGTVR